MFSTRRCDRADRHPRSLRLAEHLAQHCAVLDQRERRPLLYDDATNGLVADLRRAAQAMRFLNLTTRALLAFLAQGFTALLSRQNPQKTDSVGNQTGGSEHRQSPRQPSVQAGSGRGCKADGGARLIRMKICPEWDSQVTDSG